jgi:hypothetical protein
MSDNGGNGFKARTIQKLIFDSELRLLGMGLQEVSANLEDRFLDARISVEVPSGTRFVHVSLSASHMIYGTREEGTPRKLVAVGYDIVVLNDEKGNVDIDENGCCTINFKAILQDTPLQERTGPWAGRFVLEVMCFGTK